MIINSETETRKRERETRVRRVNKTHATCGVPPLPLPRLPRGARHGTQGAALLPQVLGSPHSPWFLLFSFWGKKENDTTYPICWTPLSLIKRNNSSSNALCSSFIVAPWFVRCQPTRSLSFDPRGPQSTTTTNAAGGGNK